MKIYFCGSIKGGRQLVDLYKKIIERLKNYGEVLTEHIGDANYAKSGYNPPCEVYAQDVAWLDSADVVFAEITVPSLGVGYELAYAEARAKKVICVYDSSASVSSMIIGNKYFDCRSYKSERELFDVIDLIFSKGE